MKQIVFLCLLLIVGCNEREKMIEEVDQFMRDNHGFLYKKNKPDLVGPYGFARAQSMTNISTELPDGKEVMLNLRGIVVPDEIVTNKYHFGGMSAYVRFSDLYLLKDSVINVSSNIISGIVCKPTTKVYIGKDPKTEELMYDALVWEVVQMHMLIIGRAVVDRSDTNHSYYQAFLDTEALARKHKEGYWASNTELPVRTEEVSQPQSDE